MTTRDLPLRHRFVIQVNYKKCPIRRAPRPFNCWSQRQETGLRMRDFRSKLFNSAPVESGWLVGNLKVLLPLIYGRLSSSIVEIPMNQPLFGGFSHSILVLPLSFCFCLVQNSGGTPVRDNPRHESWGCVLPFTGVSENGEQSSCRGIFNQVQDDFSQAGRFSKPQLAFVMAVKSTQRPGRPNYGWGGPNQKG